MQYIIYSARNGRVGEPGAWYYEEKDKDTICVVSFPENYTGDIMTYYIDIGVPKEPRFIKSTKTPMTRDEITKKP